MDEQGFGEVWDVMVYGTGPNSAVLAAGFECSEGVAGALCHAEKILEGVLRIPPEAYPHSLAGAERRAASPTCLL
jgi:hypothetical protein